MTYGKSRTSSFAKRRPLLAVETFEVDAEVVGVVESSELSVRAEMKTLHFLMLFLCLLFPSDSAADESNGNYTDISDSYSSQSFL